ncbi:hypothetical protein TCAL_12493, partial [Tigriopus californicus]
QCSNDCPKVMKPICGSDGVTYANECLLNYEACKTGSNIKITARGPCTESSNVSDTPPEMTVNPALLENGDEDPESECDQNCPKTLKPVCGSDGETYPNDCELNLVACQRGEFLAKTSDGACPSVTESAEKEEILAATVPEVDNSSDCESNCSAIYAPLCGSDNVTYSSWCHLKEAECVSGEKIFEISQGPCREPNTDALNAEEDDCPDRCQSAFKLVCGSDGNTYSSECSLREFACKLEQNVTWVHDGPCPRNSSSHHYEDETGCNCTVSFKYAPVCGTNNQTYPEECILQKEACAKNDPTLVVKYLGVCAEDTRCARSCRQDFEPVCGSDGSTYSNRCTLESEACQQNKDINVLYEGVCGHQTEECPKLCMAVFEPVCGSDNQTYANECELKVTACKERSNLTLGFVGSCEMRITRHSDGDELENKDCPDICPLIFKPTCGTDGQTYDNECKLRSAACFSKTNITVEHEGSCKTLPQFQPIESEDGGCHFSCQDVTTIPVPVCSSNNETYGSECEMKKEACLLNLTLTVQSEGTCDQPKIPANNTLNIKKICPVMCPAKFKPVCGSDGESYDNECRLEMAQCERDQKLFKAFDGLCETKERSDALLASSQSTDVYSNSCNLKCTNELRPVCGTNGQTFNNRCLLDMFNCENTNLVGIDFEGDCDFPILAALEQEEISNCELSCSAEDVDPVCGTDGKTYSSECFLKRWSCQLNKPIYVSYRGPCASNSVPEIIFAALETEEQEEPQENDCNFRCTNEYRPVCGDNGETFGSQCQLDQSNCLNGTNISTAFQGDCSLPPVAALEADEPTCSEFCPLDPEPVCGTDGLTYTNECFLLKKACEQGINLWVSYPSPCGTLFKSSDKLEKCPTGCSKIKKPVCGNDGITYDNACLLKMHNCQQGTYIKVKFAGDCATPLTLELRVNCRATCSGLDHVCGTDGLTYDNECSLKKWACLQNQTTVVAHASTCKRDDLLQPIECPQECPEEKDEVCGSDGQTYPNECKLRKQACLQETALRKLLPGKCPSLEEVFCALEECPNYFKPVCASDNSTYENECHFHHNNTCGDVKTGITILAHDFCETLKVKGNSNEDCQYDCSEIDSPVCGSDQRSYLNGCFLKAAACQTESPITIVHTGECEYIPSESLSNQNECPKLCPAIFAPVCGSDNNTYDNECSLKAKACFDKISVSVAYPGKCEMTVEEVVEKCAQICPTIYAPVCGTDGKSYPNECHLKAKACRDKSGVTVASIGECPSIMEDQPCPVLCPAIYAPVCGSDGQTYPSECNLKSTACQEKSSVVIEFIGECPMIEEDSLADICPALCPAIYAPVCGSDGQTYPSKCNFMAKACEDKSNLTIVSIGECPSLEQEVTGPACPTFCPAIYAPVCGTDGQTYPSDCNLKAQACQDKSNLAIASFGECRQDSVMEDNGEDCATFCPEVFSPICGTDNNTYSNECSLKSKSCLDKTNVTAAYPGACVALGATGANNGCPLLCPETNSPVCGSDNKTYTNECHLRKEVCQAESSKLTIASFGECLISTSEEGQEDCPIFCPAIYAPVCGSDNASYPNECSLKAKGCAEKVDITVLYNGECVTTEGEPSTEECPQKCPTIFSPVCGSDGKTYTNECNLKVQTCAEKTGVTVAFPGFCDKDMLAALEEDCPIICPTLIAPVCGSDGKTYSNECSLDAQACIEKSGVTIAHSGACPEEMVTEEIACPNDCPDNFAPVCGSDGETYMNACALKLKKCESATEIFVAHDGKCLKDILETTLQECPLICPSIEAPVCGSDGETYPNDCSLKAKACTDVSQLTIAHIGMCLKDIVEGASGECPVVCPAIDAPVCGSDDKTYPSECSLKATACAEKSGLVVAYAGKCETDQKEE